MSLTKVSYSMIYGAPVNILDFGADPTGTSDSTTAIQNALDSSNSVYIPEGTFLVKTIIVDSSQHLFGAGSGVSVLKKVVSDNAEAIRIVNTINANVPTASQINDIKIQGATTSLDPTLGNAHGILCSGDSGTGGTYIVKTNIENVYFERLSGDAIRLNGVTGSNIIGCDMFINLGCGVKMITTGGVFNNAVRISYNRIKHNSLGIYGGNFPTPGITTNPSGVRTGEVNGNTISNNLIEANFTSPTTGDIFSKTGIGTSACPSIGLILEGADSWFVENNWFEQHYQHIKLNGANKQNKINENWLGYLGTPVVSPDASAPLVFAGNVENSINYVEGNTFTDTNQVPAGTYDGQSVLLINNLSQANMFINNTIDSSNDEVVITPGVTLTKNIVLSMNANNTSELFYKLNNRFLATKLYAVDADASLNLINTVGGFTDNNVYAIGENSGSSNQSFIINMSSSTDGGATKTRLGEYALGFRASHVAATITIMSGNFTPEGSITASPGSLYLRQDGGAGTTLYVKESGTGNTGWVGK